MSSMPPEDRGDDQIGLFEYYLTRLEEGIEKVNKASASGGNTIPLWLCLGEADLVLNSIKNTGNEAHQGIKKSAVKLVEKLPETVNLSDLEMEMLRNWWENKSHDMGLEIPKNMRRVNLPASSTSSTGTASNDTQENIDVPPLSPKSPSAQLLHPSWQPSQRPATSIRTSHASDDSAGTSATGPAMPLQWNIMTKDTFVDETKMKPGSGRS